MNNHVFISYVHEDRMEVERLRIDLIANGLSVWWDHDIPPGMNWKLAIRAALRNSFAFVFCVSQQLAQRDRSWAFPEVRDAIGILRQRAPDKPFLFLVRFSPCELPDFQIDSTSSLEDLQLVDLFPAVKRSEALSRLVRALREVAP